MQLQVVFPFQGLWRTVLWTLRKYFMDIFIVDDVQIYRNTISIASPLRIDIPTIIVMSAYKENDDNYNNYDQIPLTDPTTPPINAEDVSVTSNTSAMIRFYRL
jgi:hypothetical protein